MVPCRYLGIYKMDLLHLEVAEGDATGCRQDEAQEVGRFFVGARCAEYLLTLSIIFNLR